MFTGLITDIGELMQANTHGKQRRLRIACSYPQQSLAIGASIACNGICLTITHIGTESGQNWFEVEASPETMACTTLSGWKPGEQVNLEQSLKLGGELGGHIVTGHVDGVAKIMRRHDEGASTCFTIAAPDDLTPFIAAKGSVALDGTSLTVNHVQGAEFEVMLIPHSLRVTTWGEKKAGDLVNIEVDLIARYAARLLETHSGLDSSGRP